MNKEEQKRLYEEALELRRLRDEADRIAAEESAGMPAVARTDRRNTFEEPPLLMVRFREFHAANPQVYEHLVRLSRRGKRVGAKKLGMKQLFEVLRWQTMLSTRDAFSDFKLNNDYTAPYARLIMRQEPDLAGMFELRRSHADEVLDA